MGSGGGAGKGGPYKTRGWQGAIAIVRIEQTKKPCSSEQGFQLLLARSSKLVASSYLSTYLPCRRRGRPASERPSSLPESRPPALPWSASATRSSPRWSAPSAPLSSDPAPPPSRDLHSRPSARC